MDLWIKDKEKTRLCKADFIEIGNLEYNNGDIDIVVNGHYFGRYGRERAMEIIDEISNLLNPILLFQNTEVDEKTLNEIKKVGALVCNGNSRVEAINNTVVYQMPEN